MRRWLIILALAGMVPFSAFGQAVKVTSGEHPDFTRLVLQFGAPVDWKMGRTEDGYELQLPNKTTRYDLSKAFDLIGRSRLAAIWEDPDSGALHIGVACACFAMPFEFRPGTIVIDIRNGDPPKSSSFELPIEAPQSGDLAENPDILPKEHQDIPVPGQSYDWTALALEGALGKGGTAPLPLGLTSAGTSGDEAGLDSLRQSLIEQLSRGASQGIVDMAKPKEQTDGETDSGPSVRLTLGEEPALIIRQKGEEPEPLRADGGKCVPDEALTLGEWSMKPPPSEVAGGEHSAESAPAEGAAAEAPKHEAAPAEAPKAEAAPAEHGAEGAPAEDPNPDPLETELPVAVQMALAQAGMIGEFDRPDPEAVKRAIRFNLYLGFGAEARALLRAFPGEQEDADIWQSLAHILDGEADPTPAFKGMESCDTAAALWATLSDPNIATVGPQQKAAILRAFSALPTHLRQLLGPSLVDRFLQMHDVESATAIRDAVLRVPGEAGPQVELMQAAMDKAGGSPATSVARLEELAKDPGNAAADVLVALVEQRAELGQDVSFDQVQALEEYAKERKVSADGAKFHRALTLAYAASGDFDKAFETLTESPDAAPVVWQILASAAPDSAFLNHAALLADQIPPIEAKRAASLMATRFLKLGLADQAAQWLSIAPEPPALLSARVALAKGDAQESLRLIEGDSSANALTLRAEALHYLGDEKGAAEIYAQIGAPDDQLTSLARSQDWAGLAETGPQEWKSAVEALSPPLEAAATGGAPAETGPLAKSRALVTESESTRSAISALLDSVKSPAVPSQ